MATMFKTALILLAVATSIAAAAQTSDNVLLIVNEASPVSLEVGQYYSQRRSIAKNQILRVKTCLQESIARADYESQIQAPIASWLARESAHDGILYIVLTKGAPLRIEGSGGPTGTAASIDSELTLLYRKLTCRTYALPGRVDNGYFLSDAPISQGQPFSGYCSRLRHWVESLYRRPPDIQHRSFLICANPRPKDQPM